MDPLEDRLRRTLGDARWRLPADQALLDEVHKGAARRRRRRAALNTTAAVAVVVAGVGLGSYVVTSRHNERPVAQDGNTRMSTASSGTAAKGSTEPSVSPHEEKQGSTPPSADTSTRQKTEGSPPGRAAALAPMPAGFRAASLSAASKKTFWVLGSDANRSAVVAKTSDSGASFGVSGRIDAFVEPDDEQRNIKTVSDLRFVDPSNGWAYGKGLWATHNGGAKWKHAPSVNGRVTRLEAAAGSAFALVESDGATRLMTSPASSDKWSVSPVKLLRPDDIAAARGIVAIADATDTKTYAMVSEDKGATFEQRSIPCDASTFDVHLSATKEALWLHCSGGMAGSVQVSTDKGRSWKQASTSQGVPLNVSQLGARDDKHAVLAVPDAVMQVSPDSDSTEAPVDGLKNPRFVGFTDSETGYAISSDGKLFRTTNGGNGWKPLPLD